MTDLDALVGQLSELGPLDLLQLKTRIEDEWGVQGIVAVRPGDPTVAEAPEEQASFTVRVTSAGQARLAVIKAVRELTGLSLKEAKDAIDQLPFDAGSELEREQAETLRDKLAAAGAEVDLV